MILFNVLACNRRVYLRRKSIATMQYGGFFYLICANTSTNMRS